MGVGECTVGGGDGAEDFLDGKVLAYHAGGHDEGAAWVVGGRGKAGVDRVGHASCVFEATSASHGVGAAGVDDDGSDTFAVAPVQHFAADGDGGGLEFVLREDGGGGAGG